MAAEDEIVLRVPGRELVERLSKCLMWTAMRELNCRNVGQVNVAPQLRIPFE